MGRVNFRPLAALCLLSVLVSLHPGVAMARTDARGTSAPRSDVSYRSLGGSDVSLVGPKASLDIYLPGGGDLPLTGDNWVEVVFGHSELLDRQSTLTVRWNDLPLRSEFLTPDNTMRTALRVPLPAGRIDPDANKLTLVAHMRLSDAPCSDVDNPALNTTIYRDTAVHYGYASLTPRVEPLEPDLSRFPWPILRPNGPRPSAAAFVVPAAASPAELTAAARLAASFGRAAGGQPFFTSLEDDGAVPPDVLEERHLVLIGTPAEHGLIRQLGAKLPLRLGDDGRFLDPSGRPIADEHGVVQQVVSPWNPARTVLMVSGASDEALDRATAALTGRPFGRSLSGPYAIVREAAATGPMLPGQPDLDGGVIRLSLEELGRKEGDDVVSGVGLRKVSIPFDSPPPGKRGSYALSLILSHSPILDTRRSSVRVALNDVPVSSINLDESNVERTVTPLNLPAVLFRAGPNTLDLTFTLRTPHDPSACGAIPEEKAWATVAPSSQLQIPLESPAAGFHGAQFPYPFLRRGDSSAALLLLSPEPAERRAALDVAVALGRASRTAPLLRAAVADDASDELLAASDILAVGLPTSSPTLADLAEDLPVRLFGHNGRVLVDGRGELVVEDGARVGVIASARSPYTPQRGLMLISGTDLEGLGWAIEGSGLRGLAGNVVIVTPNQDSQPDAEPLRRTAYTLSAPLEDEPAPAAAPRRPPAAILLATGLGGLVVGLLALLALASRRGSRPPEARDEMEKLA